jgi:hypothetical protein
MPRGIPKNKANGMSKMDCMRRALAEMGSDAENRDIQKFLKSQLSLDMDVKMISGYKTYLKAANKSAAIRKPGIPAAAPVVADGITLDDIRAVKQVVNKIGADKVRNLAAALGD